MVAFAYCGPLPNGAPRRLLRKRQRWKSDYVTKAEAAATKVELLERMENNKLDLLERMEKDGDDASKGISEVGEEF